MPKQSFFALLTRYSVQDWLWFIVPTSTLLALIVGAGPYLQQVIGLSINSQDAVSQQAIVRLPTLTNWLMGALLHYYAVISFVVVIIGLQRTTLTGQSVATAFWFGTLLTASDLFMLVGRFDSNIVLPQTIFYNYIGGLFLGLFYFCSTCFYIYIYDLVKEDIVKRRVIPAVCVIAMGLLVSSTLFFGVSFVYRPVTAILYAEFSENAAAMVISKGKRQLFPLGSKSRYDLPRGTAFSQIPRSSLNGGLELTRAGDGPFSVGWRALKEDARFSITVRGYADCPFREIDELPNARPLLENAPARSFSTHVQGGNGEIRSQISGTVAVHGDQAFSLGTSAGSDPNRRNISGFLSGVGVRYVASDDITYLVSSALMDTDGRRSLPTEAVFTMSLDGRPKELRFEPRRASRSSDLLECRAIEAAPGGSGWREWNLDSSARSHVSFLITVQTATPSAGFHSESQELHIKGLNGWIELNEVPIQDIKNQSLGAAELFVAQLGLVHMEVGGRSLDVRETDNVIAMGTLQGHYADDGNLAVTGRAHSIWRNDVRVNLTKWELLAGEMRVALLTAFLAAIGAGAEGLRRLVRAMGHMDRKVYLGL